MHSLVWRTLPGLPKHEKTHVNPVPPVGDLVRFVILESSLVVSSLCVETRMGLIEGDERGLQPHVPVEVTTLSNLIISL